MRGIVFLILLISTLGFGQQAPQPGQKYAFLNANSSKCLDAYKKSKRPGGEVYQWQYLQIGRQYFQFIPTDSGFYKIVSSNSGLFLAAINNDRGRNITQKLNQSTHLQQWYLEWRDSIYFRIVNRANHLCLDVRDASQKSRAPIMVYPKLNRKSQFWRLYPKEDIDLLKRNEPIGKPEHLGDSINTKYDEVYPVISPDGNDLFICRKGMPEQGGYGKDDIYFSTLAEDGSWPIPQPFSQPINNAANNYVCSITPDGNTILLGSKYTKSGKCVRGASLSHKTDTGWCYPQPMRILNYKNSVKWSGYFLANDRKTLLLAVGGKNTHGLSDIYVSFLQGDSAWSEPKNLGPVVNTPLAENTPFLAADGKTLFFASEGHPGYGYSDIFVSRRLDDTWTNWSKPKNLGRPFNTPKWDAYFTIPASGEYAYFVSETDGERKNDIYRVPLPTSYRPDPVLLVYGKVLDKATGKPLMATVHFNSLEDHISGTAQSDVNGDYKLVLPAGKAYEIFPELENYASESSFNTTNIDAYGEKEANLYLIPFKNGQTFVLNNLFFEFNEATVKKTSYGELNRLLDLMEKSPSLKIEIGGHTDNRGSDALNDGLSRRRAKAVVDFLVEHGISTDRLTFKGYGKHQPIATNATEEGRALNRRVEVKFITGF